MAGPGRNLRRSYWQSRRAKVVPWGLLGMGTQEVTAVNKTISPGSQRDQTAIERWLRESECQMMAGAQVAAGGKTHAGSLLTHSCIVTLHQSLKLPLFPLYSYLPPLSKSYNSTIVSLLHAVSLSVPKIDSVVCFEIVPMGLYWLDQKMRLFDQKTKSGFLQT